MHIDFLSQLEESYKANPDRKFKQEHLTKLYNLTPRLLEAVKGLSPKSTEIGITPELKKIVVTLYNISLVARHLPHNWSHYASQQKNPDEFLLRACMAYTQVTINSNTSPAVSAGAFKPVKKMADTERSLSASKTPRAGGRSQSTSP